MNAVVVPMFKSEKHNLILNVIILIVGLIVIYSVIPFSPPLWFNIVYPLIIGIPVIGSVYKILRKDKR